MIRIAITPAAFEAFVLDRLRAICRPGESYSDVILRLAHLEASGT